MFPAKPITHKVCTECKDLKTLESFSPFGMGKYGRAAKCKPCRSKLNVIWARNKRERLRREEAVQLK